MRTSYKWLLLFIVYYKQVVLLFSILVFQLPFSQHGSTKKTFDLLIFFRITYIQVLEHNYIYEQEIVVAHIIKSDDVNKNITQHFCRKEKLFTILVSSMQKKRLSWGQLLNTLMDVLHLFNKKYLLTSSMMVSIGLYNIIVVANNM